jgi:hypothetical protein
MKTSRSSPVAVARFSTTSMACSGLVTCRSAGSGQLRHFDPAASEIFRRYSGLRRTDAASRHFAEGSKPVTPAAAPPRNQKRLRLQSRRREPWRTGYKLSGRTAARYPSRRIPSPTAENIDRDAAHSAHGQQRRISLSARSTPLRRASCGRASRRCRARQDDRRQAAIRCSVLVLPDIAEQHVVPQLPQLGDESPVGFAIFVLLCLVRL